METIGIVLNIDKAQTEAFEAGFREMEGPTWLELYSGGALVMATLSRLDISTYGRVYGTETRLGCMYQQSTVDSTTSADPGPSTNVELVAELGDIGALRGVTEAAADLSECTCPESCERDHANE